jgi:hypothetical protein
MLMASSSAQSTSSKVYGYVSVKGVPANGITVILWGQASGQQAAVTSNNLSNNNTGYYEFVIENGSGGFTVSATDDDGNTDLKSFILALGSIVQKDLDLRATPTPTPTPVPTATPTPRPSHEPGGMVVRNDSSSFTPIAANGPTTTPIPTTPRTPTATPNTPPAPTPTPTPVPAAGIFSSVYIWLIMALVAIMAIAAATLLYRKK